MTSQSAAATIAVYLCHADNFGALIHDPATGRTAAIDVPSAEATQKELDARGWTLTDILVTHHHDDHIEGIAAMKAAHRCRVVAAGADAHRIPHVDETVAEGETVMVGTLHARVIDTPGHTVGHIAYWFDGARALFAGDTLFSLGCGRLFEGSPAQMWDSMQKLRALPDDTMLYCGHEYTASNARFAVTVDPQNRELADKAAWVAATRAADKFTLPILLGEEKRTNPYLRADSPDIAAAMGMAGSDPVAVLAEMRQRKNNFRG